MLDKTLKKIIYVVEIDGPDHHTVSGRRKTAKRNRHYEEAGLKLILIDKVNIAYMGMGWEKAIRQQIVLHQLGKKVEHY